MAHPFVSCGLQLKTPSRKRPEKYAEMKEITWKTVFATMNPSPVFEAIAELVELRSGQQIRALVKETDSVLGVPVVSKND